MAVSEAAGRETDGFAGEVLAWAGAALISTVGLIHLLQAEEIFTATTYLGFLFLANFIACAAVAVALARNGRRLAWLCGDLICAGAIVGFLVSRTLGLPAYEEVIGQWLNFPAAIAVLVELAFLAVSALALTSRGRSAVAEEERKLEHEAELSPGRLEQEMTDLRARMTPDLRDLRAHTTPQAAKGRITKNVRRRLLSLLGRGEE